MRSLPMAWLLLAASACVAAPDDTVSGRVEVTDGDSFVIAGRRVRLHAVDAPEGRQTCRRNGEVWACGEAAAARLRELVAGRTVTCKREDDDSYGRLVAVCHNGSTDLGRAMVSAGLALAYRQYGNDYVDAENAARAARRGIWASEFTVPWELRRDERRAASAPAQPRERSAERTARNEPRRGGCNIKGNVSNNGKIYHLPGSARYDDTEIDESKGERWFCSEAEARAAGWRAPRG